MKRLIPVFLLFFLLFENKIVSQIIPIGISQDSLLITTPANTYIIEGRYGIHYYKPSNLLKIQNIKITYNPTTSPILFFIHGLGGNGSVSIDLKDLADRQNALIVAPTMHNGQLGWAYATEVINNTTTTCQETYWYTQVTKDIYRHVLNRESRASIATYLTGFSAGGQFVTRYMLIRQFSPDSIPIKMAVSVTLMTDTFNSAPMVWTNYRCGLGGYQGFRVGPTCTSTLVLNVSDFICNEHIMQYYNENYGVLIGTADTQPFPGFCSIAQGTDRFDRAKKFFAFSTTNAITRGTTLKWQYDSVAGVGHDQILMYTTKRNLTDTFTIAERLLFKTPYHTVQQFTPTCLNAVGIKDNFLKDNEISIYPNPNNGLFTIFSKSKATILITDLLGREIRSINIEEGKNEIYLSDASNGIYFIKVKTNSSQEVNKFIIQK